MLRQRGTLPVRATVALAAISVGSTLVLAGSGGAAVASTALHQAPLAVAPGTYHGLGPVTVAPKSSDAWAVAKTFVTDTEQSTFAVAHRHNNHWSRLAVEGKPNETVSLLGIAAGSAKQVWAVGASVSDADVETPLLARSTGGTFKPVSVKGLTSGAHLGAVAASSPKNAWVMGVKDDDSASFTLHWNGKKWTKSSLVVKGDRFFAYGISTSSSHDAWAVGTAGSGNAIIHWNGKKWSVSDTLPASEALSDIVTTGAHVWAVGGGQKPLAVSLTASGWKTIHLKHSPKGFFHGVTAVGNTAYAVGATTAATVNGAQEPIFAKLHGTTGAYGSIKKEGESSGMADVAASTKAIVAVGAFTTGKPSEAHGNLLAEAFVHNKWKLSAVPADVAPAS